MTSNVAVTGVATPVVFLLHGKRLSKRGVEAILQEPGDRGTRGTCEEDRTGTRDVATLYRRGEIIEANPHFNHLSAIRKNSIPLQTSLMAQVRLSFPTRLKAKVPTRRSYPSD